MTPTNATIAHLRARGWLADEVERRVTSRLKRDYLGIADVVALRNHVVLLVQATTKSNVSARVKRVSESEYIHTLREFGIMVQVWGWPSHEKEGEPRIVDCS